MRIRRVEVAGFGSLRDRLSGPEPLGDFVVVLGENEAGKTTLFEFLCSMLYGIYPTASDRHPYSPWDGTELGGSLRIQVEGDEVEVRRRLLSSPSGTLIRNGNSEGLRNDDLPFLSHVSSRVFRQVHAIGLGDLASLAEEGWEAVQDRILGRLGATDLRPAREVADELMAEARTLWRPDRRGTPRVRQLDEAILEAASRRPEVRQQSHRRRAAAERLAETRRVLESARAAREADQALLGRLRRWVPIRREMARLAELRKIAGDPVALEGLPADPLGELDHLEERSLDAKRHLDRCRAELDEVTAEADSLDVLDRTILEHEGAIESLRASASEGAVLTPRLGAAEQELRALERRLDDEFDRLPWASEVTGERLVDLPIAALGPAHRRWSEAAMPRPAPSRPRGTASAIPAAALVLVGLIVLATAVPGWAEAVGLGGIPRGYPLLLGSVFLVVGGWLWTSLRRQRRELDHEAARLRADADAHDAEERDARSEFADLLAPYGLGVGPQPDPELLPRLDRCRQLIRDRNDLRREVGDLRSRLDEVAVEAARLRDLLLVNTTGDPVATSTLLLDRLGRARERDAATRRASARLPTLRSALQEASEAAEAAPERKVRFERRLADFAGDDPRSAASRAARAVEAHQDAERRRAALAREHPDLDRVVDEIRLAEERQEAWILEADPVGALGAEIDTRSGEIEQWVALEKELESQAELRDGDETIDDLEGEITRLRDDRDAVRREHDRLWIMASLVDQADRDVRERHQPAILRLAGDHLSALTAGRYDRLEVGSDRSRTLQVSGPAAPGPVEVGPPLSTGTQEQIYVALRLALMDHLDEGQVRLPLFLDEVLVNWDSTRRGRGLDLLEAMAARRQVFLFTCHPHLADEAAARGAARWRLDPP